MKQIFYGACLTLCTTLLLTGCVDNGYDLSNIDTTSELKVVDLQLPVNLDAITLDDIITIDEDSKIKIRDVDGKPAYVVTEQGEFNSDKITINEFSAEAPVINPSRLVFGPPPPAHRNARLTVLRSLSGSIHSKTATLIFLRQTSTNQL